MLYKKEKSYTTNTTMATTTTTWRCVVSSWLQIVNAEKTTPVNSMIIVILPVKLILCNTLKAM
jgi:hypothetical protein